MGVMLSTHGKPEAGRPRAARAARGPLRSGLADEAIDDAITSECRKENTDTERRIIGMPPEGKAVSYGSNSGVRGIRAAFHQESGEAGATRA